MSSKEGKENEHEPMATIHGLPAKQRNFGEAGQLAIWPTGELARQRDACPNASPFTGEAARRGARVGALGVSESHVGVSESDEE